MHARLDVRNAANYMLNNLIGLQFFCRGGGGQVEVLYVARTFFQRSIR